MTKRLLCAVCGRQRDDQQQICSGCRRVGALVLAIDLPLYLVVDGSFREGMGGAGLVLVVENLRGDAIATCVCRFACGCSREAEEQAIYRGARWAPGVRIFTDHVATVRRLHNLGRPVEWIQPDVRVPNHNLAHRLANAGRLSSSEQSRGAD